MGQRASAEDEHLRFESEMGRIVDRVRRAVIARFGFEIGAEAAAETQVWAWANQDQVRTAENPAGLLFRVAQSRARPHTRWRDRRAPVELLPDHDVSATRPELVDLMRSLARIDEPQRVAVVLVHGYGERYDDVAELLGISRAAVANHVHRGLTQLRRLMKEVDT